MKRAAAIAALLAVAAACSSSGGKSSQPAAFRTVVDLRAKAPARPAGEPQPVDVDAIGVPAQ